MPLPTPATSMRYERLNLVMSYLNSLVFTGLLGAENTAAFLVKSVFNGSGIIMVAGLLSLVAGNLWAYFGHSEAVYLWGAHFANKMLYFIQCALFLAFLLILILKQI